MANFTDMAIMMCFEKQLTSKSFDKITVSDIVNECGISSSTFYYHYHDIYDLLNEWLKIRKKLYLSGVGKYTGWEDILGGIMYLLKKNRSLVYNTVFSGAREITERFIFDVGSESFYRIVKMRSENMGYELSEEAIKETADFCSYSMMGFLLTFFWNNMENNIAESTRNLGALFEGCIESMLKNYSDAQDKK